MNGTQFANYDDVTMNDVCCTCGDGGGASGADDSSTPFPGGTCVDKEIDTTTILNAALLITLPITSISIVL
eukprot:scaffold352_cov203-Chaetoceros_neogracile.AAC.10